MRCSDNAIERVGQCLWASLGGCQGDVCAYEAIISKCANTAQGVTAARYAEKSADWQEGFDRGGNAAARAIREILDWQKPSKNTKP